MSKTRGPQSPFTQIAEFHAACDVQPAGPLSPIATTYSKLFAEEVSETCRGVDKLVAASSSGKSADLVEAVAEIADGLIDTMVVSIGWLRVMGLDPAELWREVHRSNMAKVGPDGKVLKREDGKILKPDGWQPPQIKAIVARRLGVVRRTSKDLDAQLQKLDKGRETIKDVVAQSSMVERMFSIGEAAALLSVSTTFISDAIKSGELRHKVFGAKTIRIPESALAEYQK